MYFFHKLIYLLIATNIIFAQISPQKNTCKKPKALEKVSQKYDINNYAADCPLKPPIGDSNLGETYLPNEHLSKEASGEFCGKTPGCMCKDCGIGEAQNPYLEQTRCDQQEELIYSKCNKQAVIDSECKECGITHPKGSNKLILHCVGCRETNGLPVGKSSSNEISLLVEYLELPHYKEEK